MTPLMVAGLRVHLGEAAAHLLQRRMRQPADARERRLPLRVQHHTGRQAVQLRHHRRHPAQERLAQRLDVGQFLGDVGDQLHHLLRARQAEFGRRVLERPLHGAAQARVALHAVERRRLAARSRRRRRIEPGEQLLAQLGGGDLLVPAARLPAGAAAQHFARQRVADRQAGDEIQRFGDQPEHAAVRARVLDAEFALQRA